MTIDIVRYGALQGKERAAAREYLIEQLASPDKGSIFAKKFGPLRHALRFQCVRSTIADYLLQERDYDALLAHKDGRIVGHAVFQTHPDDQKFYEEEHNGSLRVFSFRTDEAYQRQGVASALAREAIVEARASGLELVAIGGGGQEHVNTMYGKICERAAAYRVEKLEKKNLLRVRT